MQSQNLGISTPNHLITFACGESTIHACAQFAHQQTTKIQAEHNGTQFQNKNLSCNKNTLRHSLSSCLPQSSLDIQNHPNKTDKFFGTPKSRASRDIWGFKYLVKRCIWISSWRSSSWIISPGRSKNKKYLKPPPRIYIGIPRNKKSNRLRLNPVESWVARQVRSATNPRSFPCQVLPATNSRTSWWLNQRIYKNKLLVKLDSHFPQISG